MRHIFWFLGVSIFWIHGARAHDIPNARVDRSIQVIVGPETLRVEYEIGLSELTLVRDLRALIGSLPGESRDDWFREYGKISGPLNARGLIVTVDGRELALRSRGYTLKVEEHPEFTFSFETDIPEKGRLRVVDTNDEGGEGTIRLAIRGMGGIVLRGDDSPGEVARISIRPAWQMTDAEELRTRRVEVDYGVSGVASSSSSSSTTMAAAPSSIRGGGNELSAMLGRSGASVLGLWLGAMMFGAAHAIQPGHGKSLVAAASIGEGGGWTRGAALAITITIAHVGGVLMIAITLGMTRSTRYPEINHVLARGAGFVIAAIGLWRLGRHLGGHGEHADEEEMIAAGGLGTRGLIGLGLAGGIVPCWDAVTLILLAEAAGRMALGLALLWAFSMGMSLVLVAVGLSAAKLRGLMSRRDRDGLWVHRLGLLSGLGISAIGFYLMAL